jgi:hypothetical protein
LAGDEFPEVANFYFVPFREANPLFRLSKTPPLANADPHCIKRRVGFIGYVV